MAKQLYFVGDKFNSQHALAEARGCSICHHSPVHAWVALRPDNVGLVQPAPALNSGEVFSIS